MIKCCSQEIESSYIHYNWMSCIADWAIDMPEAFYASVGINAPVRQPFPEPGAIKQNDIIFVKTDFLKNNFFQNNILPHIKTNFILVSGISSYSVDNYLPIISNQFLIKWFSTNPPVNNEKIIGLPIGFEEPDRVGGNQHAIKAARQASKDIKKKNKILLPYHTIENNPQRQSYINHLKSLPFVETQENKLPFNEYLLLLASYKYCICLEGSGYDTHRNYECTLVDTIPIMIESTVKTIYNSWGLPSLFVDNWFDINQETYKSIELIDFNFDKSEDFLLTRNHIKKILKIKHA